MRRFIDKAFQITKLRIPILILTPRVGSFGNCAEEIFFGLLKAKRERKKILFLYPQNLFFRKPVANKKLFRINSDYSVQNKVVFYLGTWILTVLFVFMWVVPTLCRLRTLRRTFDFGRPGIWKPDNGELFCWESVKGQSWRRQYDDYVPPRLPDNDYLIAEQTRVQMGIPLTDWFVCLHVRESGYRGDSSKNRNATIENYIESIKVITKAGGWVVRMGDPSMSALPAMDRVIDYPHTQFKSDLMDLYLISRCRFFLGTNSGPSDVATLFARPMILVNVTEWGIGFPLKRGDFVITKHIFSHRVNHFLSIREILDEPFTWQAYSALDREYIMVENTPEEIRDVVEDFLAHSEDYVYSELQGQFIEARKAQVHRWISELNEGPVQKYRIASRADSSAGTLGRDYLEQNWVTDILETSSDRVLIAQQPVAGDWQNQES